MRERGVEVELTDEARTLLGNLGYDPTYGARPLKRVIQKQLVDKLALKLLEGEFQPGDRVLVDAVDGELAFTKAPQRPSRPQPKSRPRAEKAPPETLRLCGARMPIQRLLGRCSRHGPLLHARWRERAGARAT